MNALPAPPAGHHPLWSEKFQTDPETLSRLLRELRQMPVLEEILDAAGDILSEQALALTELRPLAGQLSADLRRIVALATGGRGSGDAAVQALVGRAQQLVVSAWPKPPEGLRMCLRQAAGVVVALVDRLTEIDALDEVAPVDAADRVHCHQADTERAHARPVQRPPVAPYYIPILEART
ncbi:hypothetical protein ACFYVL_40430 [Streptomyces sp. NPDC004111]|uniref:hypothetical protein n=1 Tax=Streptomyces sp. NPDC004111 TaxID=3364690 RepID=UPI0036C896DC